jgi:hypothetical protein
MFACCGFESRSSRRVGILASDMESLDRGLILFAGFPLSAVGSAYQLRLRPALVYKVGCTCITLYYSQMGKQLSQRRATCAGGMIIECLS